MPIQENNSEIVKVVKAEIDKAMSFTSRKLADIPTDDLQVVNRKYVNLSGTTANRPTTSILGQQYFDTTLGKPIFNNGTTWVDGTSSVI